MSVHNYRKTMTQKHPVKSLTSSVDLPRAKTDSKHKILKSSKGGVNRLFGGTNRNVSSDHTDSSKNIFRDNPNNGDLICIQNKPAATQLPYKLKRDIKVKPSLLSQKVKLVDIQLSDSEQTQYNTTKRVMFNGSGMAYDTQNTVVS